MEVSLRSWLTEFILNSTFSSPRKAGAQKKKDRDQTYISSYEPQHHSGSCDAKHSWEWVTKHLRIITQPGTIKCVHSVASFPNREKDHTVCLNKDATNGMEASRPEPSAPRLCGSQFQRPRALRQTSTIFNKPASFCFCIKLSRGRQYRGKQAMIKDSVKKIKVQLPGYVLRPVNIELSPKAPADPQEENLCLH